MGAYFAVILANLWMEKIEPVLRKEVPNFCKIMEDINGICSECSRNLGIDRKVLDVKTPKLTPSKFLL